MGYIELEPSSDRYVLWLKDTFGVANTAARRRYVRLVRLDRDRVLGLVADIDGGRWAGVTFFRGGLTGAANLRTGLRVYDEEEER